MYAPQIARARTRPPTGRSPPVAPAPLQGILQRKLTVGSVDDPLEQEADSIAEKVMRSPDNDLSFSRAPPRISRACAECEREEDKEKGLVQRSPEPGEAVTETLSRNLGTSSGGRALPQSTRVFMERRFGADFSAVRIHAEAEDNEHAQQLNAQAFTIGNHIHFRRGKFDPDHHAGRLLLAHELVHTLQQGRTASRVQRKTDAEWKYEAAAFETQILAAPEYKALDGVAKGNVAWIIAQARTKPLGDAKGQRLYYLFMLLKAITTHFQGASSGSGYGCSADMAKQNRDVVDKALKTEAQWGGAYSDVDELSVATATNMVERTGEQGKKYKVDRSDPKNIRVRIKVKLNGVPDEVSKIKSLEDAIERSISMTTKGYYVDIVFVNTTGPDVFEFTVKFCEWPNSGNWASSPVTLSHEVHHALGLADRYDYIEAHAGRSSMRLEMRLDLFVQQMKKTAGPRDPYSKMAYNNNSLLAEDVCAVAFAAGADRNKCIEARKSLDPANVPP
ncbi:DUF4157 domain-containing protein [Variovorax sp. YR216]|uniref:eCIS core domain-containing protein n=1 Tax=Variovorax sp. YR216 TaxID=1882828 RepID=UPI000897C20E|nr:DUF4157 domain-containing protein [Variovorax sp. YR216]SEB20084.1 protein of unknown function [Variovorax sp. YR216]